VDVISGFLRAMAQRQLVGTYDSTAGEHSAPKTMGFVASDQQRFGVNNK
jgi:hypothetical protein